MKGILVLGLCFPSMVFGAGVPFSGLYGGINLGVTQSEIENERLAQIVMPGGVNFSLHPDDFKLTDLSISGGVTLGVTRVVKKNWLWGVEGRLNFEDLNTKFHDEIEEGNSSLIIKANRFLKLNRDLALLGKFGGILDQKYLIFGVLGIDWAHFELSKNFYYSQENIGSVQTGELQSTEMGYKIGGVLGIGTEYLITKNSTMGMEYNYIFHNELDFSNPIMGMLLSNGVIQNGSSISDSNGLQSKINRFMIKYHYYFA